MIKKAEEALISRICLNLSSQCRKLDTAAKNSIKANTKYL